MAPPNEETIPRRHSSTWYSGRSPTFRMSMIHPGVPADHQLPIFSNAQRHFKIFPLCVAVKETGEPVLFENLPSIGRRSPGQYVHLTRSFEWRDSIPGTGCTTRVIV